MIFDTIRNVTYRIMQTIQETIVPESQIVVPPEVAITFSAQHNTLAQIFASGIDFSFVSEGGEQCHQPVLCRDFLADAVDSAVNRRAVALYGFAYNAAKMPPVDLTMLRILVGNKKDNSFHEKVAGILNVLNQVEERLDLRLSVAQTVTNPQAEYKGGQFVLVGSRRWLEAGPMLSLYTLLVDVGCVHTPGTPFMDTINRIIKGEIAEYQHYDAEYLQEALPALETILKIGYRPVFFIDAKNNYPSKVDTATLHHYSTISAVGKRQSSMVIKHWTRDDLKKKPTLDKRRADKAALLAEAAQGEQV
jgi:hypothetical protein